MKPFSNILLLNKRDTVNNLGFIFKAAETNTMKIRNCWTTPIYVKNLTQDSDIYTIQNFNDILSLSVSINDEILVYESIYNETFRTWGTELIKVGFIQNCLCHLVSMPPMNRFTEDEEGTIARSYFFMAFNENGSIIDLPEGSFDISSIITVGERFFTDFNFGGIFTKLPKKSFNTENITSCNVDFFSGFNQAGALQKLPDKSFNTDKMTSVRDYFCIGFNSNGGQLSYLPKNSFSTKNMSVYYYACWDFNTKGNLQRSDTDYNSDFLNKATGRRSVYYSNIGYITVEPNQPFQFLQR